MDIDHKKVAKEAIKRLLFLLRGEEDPDALVCQWLGLTDEQLSHLLWPESFPALEGEVRKRMRNITQMNITSEIRNYTLENIKGREAAFDKIDPEYAFSQ